MHEYYNQFAYYVSKRNVKKFSLDIGGVCNDFHASNVSSFIFEAKL